MVPSEVSDTIQSSAERRVFESLREETPSDWIALHSLGLTIHDRKPWAEIDFVLIGPPGIYCLEVKGGRVERTGGVWRFINARNEVATKREGPFEQVGGASAALRRFLIDKLQAARRMTVGYGVVVPDIEFRIEGPDIEPAIVYDATNRDQPFSAYLGRLAAYWDQRVDDLTGRRPVRLSQDDVEAVLLALRGDFDLRPSLRARLQNVERELVRLTAEQKGVVGGFRDNERAIIRGGAGTGKTLLAIDLATAEARAGKRVFMTCFSRRLGDELAETVGSDYPSLTVAGFHRYLATTVASAGRTSQLPEASPDDLFQVFYPRECLEALNDLEKVGTYDLVIVDEAQDLLLDVYLDVFDVLLDGGLKGGAWWVFLDPNQDLFEKINARGMSRLVEGHPARFELTFNCRNTRQIITDTSILSGVDSRETIRADGPEVEHIWWTSVADQRRRVSRYLSRLLSGGLGPDDITVLSARRLEDSGLSTGLEGVPYPLGPGDQAGTIGFATIAGFKGLESEVIVVVDVDELDSPRSHANLYEATSRARALLTVCMSEAVRPHYELLAKEFGTRLLAPGGASATR